MHVNVRTAACNRASSPRKKNAVHEHAEPQSEREHPRPRRAARRRCSARSSTTSGRARRAPTHDQLERKPRPRGFYPQLRSPSERSDRKDKDSRSKRHRGLQRTCHVRAAHTHILLCQLPRGTGNIANNYLMLNECYLNAICMLTSNAQCFCWNASLNAFILN